MNGIEISIKADIKDAQNYLQSINNNSKQITKGILNGIGGYTRTAIRKEYKLNLHKDSGELYKSIKKRMTKKGDAVYIGPFARSYKNRVLYGYVLANGADIQAKNKDYLTFQIDGKWIKKKQVTIPSHNYIVGPAERYLNSPKYQSDLDKLMAKQTEKALKRRGFK